MVREKPEKRQRQMEWIILWRYLSLFINHGGVQEPKLKCLNVRKLMLDKMNKSLNTNIVRKNHVCKLFLTALMETFVIHPLVSSHLLPLQSTNYFNILFFKV